MQNYGKVLYKTGLETLEGEYPIELPESVWEEKLGKFNTDAFLNKAKKNLNDTEFMVLEDSINSLKDKEGKILWTDFIDMIKNYFDLPNPPKDAAYWYERETDKMSLEYREYISIFKSLENKVNMQSLEETNFFK